MSHQSLDFASDSPLKSADFLNFLTHGNGVFWRFKQGEKRVEFLNLVPIGGLEDQHQMEQMLLNLVFAQSKVMEEDFFRFKLFIKAMRHHQEGAVIFRIQNAMGQRFWLRLAGAPGVAEPELFYGSLLDITEHVSFIHFLLEKELERQTMIEHENIPVLLVEMASKTIISRNTMALQLFGFSYQEFNGKVFPDIYPPDQSAQISKAYEACLLEGQWEGPLTFIKKGGTTVEAKVKIKRLSLRERNLLRIAIYETMETQVPGSPLASDVLASTEEFSKNLWLAMAGKFKIQDTLDTLLQHPYRKSLFEAILYADIYQEKGRVDAYARGGLFDSMKPGTSFPFTGSVSQAIKENRAPFFIVEDTLLSTRPIDWALFIPYGIRSYFAKPFYRGDKLRTLLMLCSTQVNHFREKDIPLYELYFPPFLQGLKNWRKDKRGRPII